MLMGRRIKKIKKYTVKFISSSEGPNWRVFGETIIVKLNFELKLPKNPPRKGFKECL
jgi:hypothetical protein